MYKAFDNKAFKNTSNNFTHSTINKGSNNCHFLESDRIPLTYVCTNLKLEIISASWCDKRFVVT